MQGLTTSILPIFLLLGLGMLIRKFHIIENMGMRGVKRIVTQIGLPVVVFRIFFKIDFQAEYVYVVAISFAICLLSYLAGCLLRRIRWLNYRLLPYMTSGIAYGLFGLPMFQIAFGESSLYAISVIDIGNELFIWPLLIPILKAELSGMRFSVRALGDIAKSPMIISIIISITLNLLGLRETIQNTVILDGIYRVIEMIGEMVTPLILIIVGYGIVIKKQYITESFKYASVRLVVLLVIGYALKLVLLDRFIDDPLIDFGFFTMMILPPLFIVPILAENGGTKEEVELANNIVAMSIIICVFLFVAFFVTITSMGFI